MNYKQKVLDSLDRDMTLSFGCDVSYEGSVGVPHIRMGATALQTTASGAVEIYTSYTQYKEPEELEIIGHPPTLQDLLRALQKTDRDYVLSKYGALSYFDFPEISEFICDIPLQYSTLQDIPDDHECWEKLYQLLNLV